VDKNELIKVAQGKIHFTFQSIFYSIMLALLTVSLFVFELSQTIIVSVLLCIIALLASFIYYHFNTRLNAALKLLELSNKNS
jgi:ABC-type multidrug transport system permease subunit